MADPALENPFVGPIPLNEPRPIFGRDTDIRELVDLVTAKRIVLLISPSGAGKTSLLQAAVIPALRKRLNPMPVVRFSQAPGDLQGNRYEAATITALESGVPLDECEFSSKLRAPTLSACMAKLRGSLQEGRPRYPLLVFDQFEELFTADRTDWKAKRDFIAALGKILAASDSVPGEEDGSSMEPAKVPVWAIFSMREDYVAELDPYLDLFPTALAYRYRLLPLESEQAVDAIVGTSAHMIRKEAARLIVADLQGVSHAREAGSLRAIRARGRFVEPLLLQVTCRKLWEDVVAREKRCVEQSDLTENGASEVEHALTNFFDGEVTAAAPDDALLQLSIRDFIETKLISRGAVRTRFLVDDVPEHLNASVTRLLDRHVLKKDMSGDREWLELVHDRLIAPVCLSNQRWREANLSVFQRQARLWDESGRPVDLLMSGDQLSEAEKVMGTSGARFGFEQEYLESCREHRRQVQLEHARQEEIARAKRSLERQRIFLVVGVVFVFGLAAALGGVLYTLWTKQQELKMSELDARMKEAALFARDGQISDGLQALSDATQSMLHGGAGVRPTSIDLAHLRVLARLPPFEARLGSHGDQVKAVAFAEESIVSGGWDGAVKMWDRSGNKVGEAQERPGKVVSVVFSDSRKLLAAGDETGLITLQMRKQEGMTELGQVQWGSNDSRDVTSVALSTDGTRMAAASRKKVLALWDISDPSHPSLMQEFGSPLHTTAIYRVAFVPMGRFQGSMVSIDWNGKIGLWSADVPVKLLKKADMGPSPLFSLAISPDGRWVFAGDKSGQLHIWDLDAEDPSVATARIQSRNPNETMFALAFSAAPRILYSVAGEDITAWEIPINPKDAAAMARMNRRRMQNWGERLYSIAAHPTDPYLVAIGGSKSVILARTSSENLLSMRAADDEQPTRNLRGLAASGDLRSIVTISEAGRNVDLLELGSDGKYHGVGSVAMSHGVAAVAMRPDGGLSAFLGCDGEVRVKAATSQEPTTIRPATMPGVNACQAANTLSFVGRTGALVVGYREVLELWSPVSTGGWESTGKQVLDGKILTVTASPSGDAIAAAGTFGRIVAFDAKPNLPQRSSTPDAFKADVVAIAFSGDGKTIVAGADSVELTAWTWPALIRSGTLPNLHERTVSTMAVARRNGASVLFTADRAGQLAACFGELAKASCAKLGRPFGTNIAALALSEDGKQLLSAGDDLYVWSIDQGAMIQQVEKFVSEMKR
jgi:WD40 repeat protein